ncbi:hypothetical protein [Stenotrophomonas sp. 24(2023)]|uniref:hypothetical protein n=1 Tax=Stenotrophomonas sp. 24(2023) TaxID=3068324 RepID=UPI0027DFC082|nr:hypothetical protein [Stenotrophomonas sp. 24(2023)]WMJ69697.1 hypothetical protein Q9R17_00885 [Stenotrophomonas sp. 24(2023)]
MQRLLTVACYLASLAFLHRGLKRLITDVPPAVPEGVSAAYAHGYQAGYTAVALLFLVAGAACALLGWRLWKRAVQHG